MSEIGELAEFTAAAAAHDDRRRGGGSHDTPTTVLESSSQMSGGDNHSQVLFFSTTTNGAPPSVASASSGGVDGGPSPPVPYARRRPPSSFFDDSTRAIAADDSIADLDTVGDVIEETTTTTPIHHHNHDMLISNGLAAADLAPNASLSPINTPLRRSEDRDDSVVASITGGEHHDNSDNSNIPYANRPRRHQSISPETIDDSVGAATSDAHSSTVVDGFDYDKDAPQSPRDDLLVNNDDSFQNHDDDDGDEHPMDASWAAEHHKMHVSPLHGTAQRLLSTNAVNPFPAPPFYGTVLESSTTNHHQNTHHNHHRADEESAPLLPAQKTTAPDSTMPEECGEGEEMERYMAMNVRQRGKHKSGAVCT
jgi:hypothetical protein